MILGNRIQTELSHVDCEDSTLPVFVTIEGRIGTVFRCDVLDLESGLFEQRFSALSRMIDGLQDSYLIRVIHSSETAYQCGFENFRSDAVKTIGYLEKTILVSIECEGRDSFSLKSIFNPINRKMSSFCDYSDQIRSFRQSLPVVEMKALGLIILRDAEIHDLFKKPFAQVRKLQEGIIDFGHDLIGVVRLYRQGIDFIHEGSLASLMDELPLPFEVAVSAKKISKVKADLRLRSIQSRQAGLSQVLGASEPSEETERAIRETAFFGGRFFDVEWNLILRRSDEATLRRDLKSATLSLARLGEMMIETAGSVTSYRASRMGSEQHFTFTEDQKNLPSFLPFFSRGENSLSTIGSKSPFRSLILHRTDGSLHLFDPFSKQFSCFNGIIGGTAGQGKSTLINLWSSAVMSDPNVVVIKIDVGGSYQKECALVGGKEVQFSLSEPSGLNPFQVLGEMRQNNEVLSTLAEFLSVLIREESETRIPALIQAELQSALKSYADFLEEERNKKNNLQPSIDGFLKFAQELPRRKLLERWGLGGIFENALKLKAKGKEPENSSESSQRYFYYNFSSIQGAAQQGFSEGVMAAVIAEINLEMLKAGNRNLNPHGKRIVLFCDETKFFIEKNREFFLLTTANFRKFGHGVVLISQNVANFQIVKEDGSHDQGIFLNSPIRFFFKAETSQEYLKNTFQIESELIQSLYEPNRSSMNYRQAIMQDETGTRMVRIYLTPEEYWRITTSSDDMNKLYALRRAIPQLTMEEAIRCLSRYEEYFH